MSPIYEVRHELEPGTLKKDIVGLYSEILSQSPFRFLQSDSGTFSSGLEKHATREGFKLCTAKDGEGRIIGFSYGYRGLPDHWWHRNVSRFFLSHEIDEWMIDYFEFVELGVHPDFRGAGVGTTLHDKLLEGLPYRTAMLSTQAENTASIRLYEKRRWVLVKNNITFPGSDVLWVIMGRKLGSDQ